jgi:hypothetical protein
MAGALDSGRDVQRGSRPLVIGGIVLARSLPILPNNCGLKFMLDNATQEKPSHPVILAHAFNDPPRSMRAPRA